MKYKTYTLMMEKIASMMRRGGMINKKLKGDSALQTAITELVKEQPEICQTLDFIVMMEEWNWLESARHIYYLESAQVANSIINSKIALSSAEALYSGPESFILALPKDTIVNNAKAHSGVMVTVGKHSDRQEGFVNPFCEWLSTKRMKLDQADDKDWTGSFGIYITYRGSSTDQSHVVRVCMNSDELIHYINSDSLAEYMESMPDWEAKKEYSHVFSLSLEERAYQFDILKLVASFLVYKKALPGRVVSGYPVQNNEKTATGKDVKNVQPFIIKRPQNNEAQDYKTSHYRRWHFRQLTHERFYRGEHKKEAIGSRVIFVQDSVVGREVKANTVK